MIVLRSENCCDAVEVIKRSGFFDITPGVGIATHKFFEKGGKLYMFNGWHTLDEKRRWKDVTIMEVRIVPRNQEDVTDWIDRY